MPFEVVDAERRDVESVRQRAADRKGVVGLHRIGVDQRAAAPFGERERQRRLDAGGRSGYDDYAIL